MNQLQFNAIFWFICMKYRAASLLFYRVTVTGWLLKARHQGMLGRDSEPGTLNNWFQFENSNLKILKIRLPRCETEGPGLSTGDCHGWGVGCGGVGSGWVDSFLP